MFALPYTTLESEPLHHTTLNNKKNQHELLMNFMKETCLTKKVKVFAVIIVLYIFILLFPHQILAYKTL